MSIGNICRLLMYACVLPSCSDTGNKYRNIESLERPPALEISSSTASVTAPAVSATTSESIKKGLDEQVHLDKAPGGASVLVIRKPFEQAWFILDVLLNQLKLEITDRNRDDGYFYVEYDPDRDYSKRQSFWDGMMSLFGEDGYAERIYALKLIESYGKTEVTADLVPETDDKRLGGQDKEDVAKDGPDRLLQALFRTLRDGMAEQSRDGQRSRRGRRE